MRKWINLVEGSLSFPSKTVTLKNGTTAIISGNETSEPIGGTDEEDLFLNVYATIGEKCVGSAKIPYDDNSWRGLSVSDSFRRIGVASAMYDYAEKILGYTLKPSDGLEPDGQRFWKARLSEEPLYEYKMLQAPYKGTELAVYENPSLSDIVSLTAKYDLRGISDGTNVFVFDANRATHEHGMASLYKLGKWSATKTLRPGLETPYIPNGYRFYIYDDTLAHNAKFKNEWYGQAAVNRWGVTLHQIADGVVMSVVEWGIDELMQVPTFARIMRKVLPKKDAWTARDEELYLQLKESLMEIENFPSITPSLLSRRRDLMFDFADTFDDEILWTDPNNPELVIKQSRLKNQHIIGLFRNHVLIAILATEPYYKEPSISQIKLSYVIPEERNKGFVRLLITMFRKKFGPICSDEANTPEAKEMWKALINRPGGLSILKWSTEDGSKIKAKGLDDDEIWDETSDTVLLVDAVNILNYGFGEPLLEEPVKYSHHRRWDIKMENYP